MADELTRKDMDDLIKALKSKDFAKAIASLRAGGRGKDDDDAVAKLTRSQEKAANAGTSVLANLARSLLGAGAVGMAGAAGVSFASQRASQAHAAGMGGDWSGMAGFANPTGASAVVASLFRDPAIQNFVRATGGLVRPFVDFTRTAKEGLSLGGAAGAAKVLGGAMGGLAALGVSITAAAAAMGDVAESRNADNRRLARYNPASQMAYAMQSVADLQRTMWMGYKNQDSIIKTVQAVTRMRDNWSGFDAWQGRQADSLGQFGAGFSGQIGANLGALVEKIGDLADLVGDLTGMSPEQMGARLGNTLFNPIGSMLRAFPDAANDIKTMLGGIFGQNVADAFQGAFLDAPPDPAANQRRLPAGVVMPWLNWIHAGPGAAFHGALGQARMGPLGGPMQGPPGWGGGGGQAAALPHNLIPF